jgi:hypothetical protein
LFVHFSNDNVIENLQSVGISLGNNSEQISLSIERIKEVETERTTLARSNDIISEVFDKEEKEELRWFHGHSERYMDTHSNRMHTDGKMARENS